MVVWDPTLLFRQLLPDEAAVAEFLDEIDFYAINGELDAGLSFDEGIARAIERHPHRTRLLEAFRARWDETIGDVIPGMTTLIDDVRSSGLPVYGLTNFSAETWPRTKARFPVLDRLDGFVVSGEEGIRKPDPRAFDIAAARFGLAPARTLFVDDLGVNVEAAVAAGFLGHVFTDAAALRATLVSLGAVGD